MADELFYEKNCSPMHIAFATTYERVYPGPSLAQDCTGRVRQLNHRTDSVEITLPAHARYRDLLREQEATGSLILAGYDVAFLEAGLYVES